MKNDGLRTSLHYYIQESRVKRETFKADFNRSMDKLQNLVVALFE